MSNISRLVDWLMERYEPVLERDAEIEWLRGIIAARDEWACKAHERIEELEKQVVLSGWNDFEGDVTGMHIITDAQIDAAWHGPNNLITREALKELGIERCEGCGGAKGGQTYCPTCNDKGWIKT